MMQPGDFMMATRSRGYSPQQVDRVVGDLLAEREAAVRHARDLEAQVEASGRHLAQLLEQAAALGPQTYESLGETARKLFLDAKAEADRVLARAAEECRELKEAARAAANERAEESERHAERMRADAEQRARQRIKQAHETAGQIVADAQRQADGAREDARQRAQQVTLEAAAHIGAQQAAQAEREGKLSGETGSRLQDLEDALGAAERQAEAVRSEYLRRRDGNAKYATGLLREAELEAADLRDRAWQAAERIEIRAAVEQERYAKRIEEARTRLAEAQQSVVAIADPAGRRLGRPQDRQPHDRQPQDRQPQDRQPQDRQPQQAPQAQQSAHSQEARQPQPPAQAVPQQPQHRPPPVPPQPAQQPVTGQPGQ
ncbi:hypothetical protein OG946_33100 [Streptomyces sp. NBC_01808]|uniref:hypothetical protein n=1 Tax=Streptomyces sp. NBC_01808 TaxID=2975947 RepID=UPI002DDC6B7D|nr:hypothetical protein [Streptomyces sp. NBC_01808]WSA41787.1 hypothetical protein OG946_33100 [Streptomyces sp. NBC_01808]